MKPLKWITLQYYVDVDTGEAIPKKLAETEYIILRKQIYNEKTQYNKLSEKVGGIYNTAGVRHITYECTREGSQRRLSFD